MRTREMQDFIVKGKEVLVGLADSKRTWKLSVRCEKMVVHRPSMPAVEENLISYLRKGYPDCRMHLLYEAGFKRLNPYDRLTAEGKEESSATAACAMRWTYPGRKESLGSGHFREIVFGQE